MRCGKVLQGADRHNARGIDVGVGDVIVPFDVVEVHRPGNAVDLVQILEIAEQVPVVDDAPKIALEMAVIDGVEPHERHEQPPIRLGGLASEKIPAVGEALVD